MKPLINGKVWIILLASAALIGLIVLASGLNGVKFDQPNMVGFDNLFRLSSTANPEDVPQFSWFRYFIIGMFIILFLVMLGPIRPQTSKGLLTLLLRFFAFAFVVMLIMGRMAQNNPALFDGGQSLTTVPDGNVQPQQFIPPHVTPQWEFWITSLIVVTIAAFASVIFNRFIDKWLQPKKGLDEIAEIARSTLNDLSKNQQSRNVIIRSYTRMHAAVHEYRGIIREAAMTPAEFAEQLEKAGLPSAAVQELTRVFEKVRYGGQRVTPEEIKEARNCLTSILKACVAEQ